MSSSHTPNSLRLTFRLPNTCVLFPKQFKFLNYCTPRPTLEETSKPSLGALGIYIKPYRRSRSSSATLFHDPSRRSRLTTYFLLCPAAFCTLGCLYIGGRHCDHEIPSGELRSHSEIYHSTHTKKISIVRGFYTSYYLCRLGRFHCHGEFSIKRRATPCIDTLLVRNVFLVHSRKGG